MTGFSEEYTDQDILNRVKKFNRVVQSGSTCYFDVCELEGVVDYFMSRGETGKAKIAIEMGMQLHPSSLEMKMCAAAILAENGELKRALNLLEAVEAVEYSNHDVYLLKASIHAQLKEHGKSIENFRRAISLNSDHQDQILLDIAYEQENQEEFEAAIQTLHRVLEINPENDQALHEISFCYEMLDLNEELIQFFTSFLDDHPYSYCAWYNLGNIYFKTEAFEKSISAFDFSIAIEDDFTPALFNKATALIQLHKYHEAIAEFESLMTVEGVQASILCYIGECYEKLEDHGTSRLHYQHALELDPRCAEAHIGMAVLLELEGSHEDSIAHYQKALNIDNDCVTYWHLFALAAEKTGDEETADHAFQKALKLDEHVPQVWEDYATFLAAQGKTEKAIELLSAGYRSNDQASELLYRMAYYNCQINYPVDAEDLLHLAVQQDPKGLPRFLSECPEAKDNPMMLDFIKSGNFDE